MKEKRNENEKVTTDFIHLSQVVSEDSGSSIPYELVVILESCVSDPSYKALAEENMIAYLKSNEKVKQGLNSIADSPNKDFKQIQDIAKEFLDKATRPYCSKI